MTYQEFKQNIIQTISESLGTGFKVALQDITKNNDTHLDGLTILAEQSNVSPTIYLNYYYEQYLHGKSISEIHHEILRTYHEHTPKNKIDISFFTDFQKAKKHIIFKLVNYERNRGLLKKVPHVRYLDLAIVFHCLLETPDSGYATILIHHPHLSFWDISQQELFELSMENTPKLLHYQLQNMADVLVNLFHEKNPDLLDENLEPIPMYVLSNSSKLNGSGCILYKDLLADIAARLKSDFYIIPSSVHEVLLIPSQYAGRASELSLMVQEVNATQLSKEEILSDHVYYYSRLTGKITM